MKPPGRGPGERGPLFTGLRPVRTLCMISIVAFHVRWTEEAPPEPLLGVSFGLTTLQVILCALVAWPSRAGAARPFLGKRAGRLLRPWLVWSGVYLAVKVAQSSRYGHPWYDQLDPSMWLAGGSFHLWFLPYGFAASALALAGARLGRGERAAAAAAASAALGALALLLSSASRGALAPPAPLDLWLDGLPAVLFGVALGRALSVHEAAVRRRLLVLVCVLALLPAGLGALGADLAPWSQLWGRYAVAVPLACAGFSLRVPDLPLVTWLAERNMGVYVVHILALQAVDRVPPLAGLPDAGRIVSVYGLSVLSVLALDLAGRGVRRLGVPRLGVRRRGPRRPGEPRRAGAQSSTRAS